MLQSREVFQMSLGQQTVTVWQPNTPTTGAALLVCAGGTGETGNLNFAGGSIGDQLNRGGTIPGNFIVVNIHKPADGEGAFQAARFKDTIDWALKKYAVDPAKVYATGLSLSGGAIHQLMADPYSKKIAALVPVCGTKDVTWQQLIAGVKENQTPFRDYGSSVDDNPPTREAFTTYKMVADGGFDNEKTLNKYGQFIDTKTGHGGVWQQAYDFSKSDLFPWLLTKSRAGVAQPPTPPVVLPAKKLIATIKVYDDGSIEKG